jgi:hypothetical protein
MLEPICVTDFLKKHNYENFKYNQMEEVALKLSKELCKLQVNETPVTLNSIISAFLLQETTST